MKVEESINIISNKFLGKEDNIILKVYKDVLENGKMNSDDWHQLQCVGLPIISLVSNYKSVELYEAREILKRGDISSSDLEKMLINYA